MAARLRPADSTSVMSSGLATEEELKENEIYWASRKDVVS